MSQSEIDAAGKTLEECTERLVSSLPIVIRRRATFGECDPAGVVYTPVFSHYAMSAYQWTLTVLLGGPMLTMQKKHDFDSPVRALAFEFLSVIEPEQVFEMTSLVGEIRNRTFDLLITGKSVGNDVRDLFKVRLSPITVSRSQRRSIEIPAELRLKLQLYQERTQKSLV